MTEWRRDYGHERETFERKLGKNQTSDSLSLTVLYSLQYLILQSSEIEDFKYANINRPGTSRYIHHK